MHLTIRLAGYGGYGVVTASRLLGLAFTHEGLHAVQTESHGAAARGGACTADLTVSTTPIYELDFLRPNVLIVLSTPAFKKCCSISPDLSSDFLLIESQILNNKAVQIGLANLNYTNGTKVYQIQIRKIAETLGHIRYMGVASLGAFATIDDRVNLSNLEKSIKNDIKLRRFIKENLYALHQGAKSVSLIQ